MMLFIERPFILIACLVLFIPVSHSAQTYSKSPMPWREEFNIVLEDFQFHHPMTVINRSDLDTALARIRNNLEPQASAYQDLVWEAEAQMGFTPDAPDSMNIMGGYEPNSNLGEMRDWLWRNSHAAYTCALAYAYLDDTLYGTKAREVIMD